MRCPIWWEYRLTWGLGRDAREQLEAFKPTVLHIAIQDGMGHAAQRWAAERSIPVVCSHHTRFERYLSYYGLGGFLERLYWLGMRRLHRSARRRCHRRRACSRIWPRMASHAWASGPRVDRSLFVPSARRAVAPGCGWRRATPIVLLVARLRWEKGLATLVSVITLNDRGVRHRVAIVGDGLREAFSWLLPPSAAFFGTLTGAKLAEAYASSDIFLYPSTTEGWGATCLEAQSVGLPVVATTSSGIVEVVADGVGGFLRAPHNSSALADAAESPVTDDGLRREMGRRASRHAEQFAWEASGDRMLCEYARHARPVPPGEATADRPSAGLADRLASAASEVAGVPMAQWTCPETAMLNT